MHDFTVRNSHAGRTETDPPSGSAAQDRELLLLDGASTAQLRGRVAYLAELTGRLAPDKFGQLAAVLQHGLSSQAGTRGAGSRPTAGQQRGPVRAAIVAASPEQASERSARLLEMLGDGARAAVDVAGGVFLGEGSGPARIGYLFPGQGSGKGDDGGAIARRFETVRDLYRTVTLPESDDPTATIVAQPRITMSSAAGLRVMSLLGIEAVAGMGHSLGELSALHWAGAMTEAELFALATERGRVMMNASEGGGAMAGIGTGPDEVEPLLSGEPVVIAGYNGPAQTVISGPAEAVERVRQAAAAQGVKTAKVRVSHAFHSPAVAPAAEKLAGYLASRQFQPPVRRVLSTLTGDDLPAGADLRQLLVKQIREPVRFSQALSRMAPDIDMLIEVGPGRVLSNLASRIVTDKPVIPLNTDASSLVGVFSAAAAAYVLGTNVRYEQLLSCSLETALALSGELEADWAARSAELVSDGVGGQR